MDEVVDSLEHEYQLDLIELDECLARLRLESPRKCDVVVLHFFGGMKFKEISQCLDVSLSTIDKDWHFSRAWLRRAMDS